jgi:PTH1 family peptidyl-tRNA hydrolase
MSLLIFGLGNIGEKYDGTRHNIGFDVVDEVARKKNVSFSNEKFGLVAKFQISGNTVFLIKPNTFMNLSGDAVSFWKKKVGAENQEILVITDDLALPFGAIRIKKKGSSGGHNGLSDIELKLKDSKYPRMRMGIGSDFEKGQQVSYVLGKIPLELEEKRKEWIHKSSEAVLCFCTRGIDVAMNLFNG